MPSKIQAAAIVGALAASVKAHGILSAISVDGTAFTAYNPSFQYQKPAPDVIEWSCPECLDNGFVDPALYADVSKIACHKDATAGAKVAKVAAGGTIDIQWSTWPASHVGPVIDYMAKVDDATTAKATDLNFFKIDEAGYEGGEWAATKLVNNDSTWSVTVPKNLAPGQYVLRHEIIALHAAGQSGGAQNYPKCINVEVTGSGTENPTGVTADKLYTASEPGILVNIYSGDLSSYKIPGPALFNGASSGSNSGSNSGSDSSAPAPSPTSTAAPAMSPTPAEDYPAEGYPATSPTVPSPSTPTPPNAPAESADGTLADKEFTIDTFIAWLETKAASSSQKARRHARAFAI